MNFSFIGQRSARYGSWVIFETMDQDTALIPAPKYKALMENMFPGCFDMTFVDVHPARPQLKVFPNPACSYTNIDLSGLQPVIRIEVIDLKGKQAAEYRPPFPRLFRLDLSQFKEEIYLINVLFTDGSKSSLKLMRAE